MADFHPALSSTLNLQYSHKLEFKVFTFVQLTVFINKTCLLQLKYFYKRLQTCRETYCEAGRRVFFYYYKIVKNELKLANATISFDNY